MVVAVSLNYCVTEYNGVTDTEKLWYHYIFSSNKISARDKPSRCSLCHCNTRETLNAS